MTTPNFVKLQILYAIKKLHENNKVANLFSISAFVEKPIKVTAANLTHLVDIHYIKQRSWKKRGCYYAYSLSYLGKKNLPKLIYRASHFFDLKLLKPAVPRHFHPNEIRWIQVNLISSVSSQIPEATTEPEPINIAPKGVKSLDIDTIFAKGKI